MLDHLARIPGADLTKLETFDLDTGDLPPSSIADTPMYCFVDAEHTDRAIQSDFAFCEAVSHGQLVFVSHDAYIVYRGLKAIIDRLTSTRMFCRVLFLPSHLFLIDTVGRISSHPTVIARALEAWRGYLEGLLINDWYKQEFLKLCPDRNAIAI